MGGLLGLNYIAANRQRKEKYPASGLPDLFSTRVLFSKITEP